MPWAWQYCPFLGAVAVLVHGVDVRPQPLDFGLGVEPAVAGSDQGLLHVAHGPRHVAPLGFWKERMPLALEQPDVGVVPDYHVEVAQRRHFLEEPHVAGVKPIVTAGDDHSFSPGVGGLSHFRVNENGTVPLANGGGIGCFRLFLGKAGQVSRP